MAKRKLIRRTRLKSQQLQLFKLRTWLWNTADNNIISLGEPFEMVERENGDKLTVSLPTENTVVISIFKPDPIDL